MNEQTPFDRTFSASPQNAPNQPPIPPFTPQRDPAGFGPPPAFETRGGWGEQSSNWFRNNASSILLPVVALLVLGGGVYFYTRGQQSAERPIVEFEEGASGDVSGEATSTGALGSPEEKAPPREETRIILSPEGQPILGGPEAAFEGGKIQLAAQQGEGLTQLARRATREYLEKNNPGFTVSREHKIFLEDFLKDMKLGEREGKSLVLIGENVEFSEAAVKQALEGARMLTERDLKNLEQFSAKVIQL